MQKFFTRTLIGLAIGAFFIWLSARSWPLDKLLGPVSVEHGHLVVGAPPASLISGAEFPSLTAAPAAVVSQATHGWVMDLTWIIPYLLTLTAIHFLRVIRWRPLLDPIVRLDFWTHNRVGAVGFMAMFLFPLRLGELVRPYLVKKTTGRRVRMSEVLATVFVERVTDGLVVSLLLFAVLAWLPAGDPTVAMSLHVGALIALGVFVGASLLLAGTVWKHALTARLIDRTLGLVSRRLAAKVEDILDAFVRGLKRMPSARSFAWFLALTIVYWGINGVGTWFMARAFYLPVDLVGSYAMMASVVVGMMIPNSPGNVGSFWYFLLLPTVLYGVTAGSTQAIAFGLAVWFFQLVQQTTFGAWFLVRGSVSMHGVWEATHQSEATLLEGDEGPSQSESERSDDDRGPRTRGSNLAASGTAPAETGPAAG